MQNWSNRPAAGEVARACQIRRVKPGEKFRMIVLDHDITGGYTHYFQGRSQLCTGSLCPACAENLQPRWYGYLSGSSVTSNVRGIVEITPQCVEPITSWFDAHGTLRGAVLLIERSGKRANSPLMASMTEGVFTEDKLPDPLPIIEILARIWGLKSVEMGQGNLLEGPVDSIDQSTKINTRSRRKAGG